MNRDQQLGVCEFSFIVDGGTLSELEAAARKSIETVDPTGEWSVRYGLDASVRRPAVPEWPPLIATVTCVARRKSDAERAAESYVAPHAHNQNNPEEHKW